MRRLSCFFSFALFLHFACFCLGVGVLLAVSAGGAIAGVAEDALDRLNALRQQAGLTPLRMDARLAKAARAHAEYLLRHRRSGHGERVGDAGFTGETPSERALAAGYPASHVSENVHLHGGSSMRQAGAGMAAVDALMTAIYHRMGFLDFSIDRVGIASRADDSLRVTVFVMGNAAEAELCERREAERGRRFYTRVCADARRAIDADAWERARWAVMARQPAWIVWPTDGASDVLPVFSDEQPDPLPDLDVSGNPLSFVVNPLHAEHARIDRFTLRGSDGRPLAVRPLDMHNDPQHLLRAGQFAWFPLQRLPWDTTFHAHLRARMGEAKRDFAWSFHTLRPPYPWFSVLRRGQVLHLPPVPQDVLVHLPPEAAETPTRLRHVGFSYRAIDALQAEIFDVNTLHFQIIGARAGARIDVRTDEDFRFRIRLDAASSR